MSHQTWATTPPSAKADAALRDAAGRSPSFEEYAMTTPLTPTTPRAGGSELQ